MIGWTLYLIGIALAFYVGGVLRGWRDEDRATQAELARIETERWARKKFVKLPKEEPSP